MPKTRLGILPSRRMQGICSSQQASAYGHPDNISNLTKETWGQIICKWLQLIFGSGYNSTFLALTLCIRKYYLSLSTPRLRISRTVCNGFHDCYISIFSTSQNEVPTSYWIQLYIICSLGKPDFSLNQLEIFAQMAMVLRDCVSEKAIPSASEIMDLWCRVSREGSWRNDVWTMSEYIILEYIANVLPFPHLYLYVIFVFISFHRTTFSVHNQ